MAELLTEAEFIKLSAKINEEKLKSEEKVAKSLAKMKILEDQDIDEGDKFSIMMMHTAHNNSLNSMTSSTSAPINHGKQQKLQIT